jgi:octaprenyl-diphosphate synthase
VSGQAARLPEPERTSDVTPHAAGFPEPTLQAPHTNGAPDRMRDSRFARLDAMLLRGTRADLAGDLAAVEDSLARVCAGPDLRIEKAVRHVLERGGKRARPMLTCAMLRALGCDPSLHIDVLTAVELAHAGSLLHDDIIDGARMRRGHPAAHLLFDVSTAILAGDVLLTVAFERAAQAPPGLWVSFSAAVRDVCTGEAIERERLFDTTIDLAHARRVNQLKTAALFRYAAEAGAILAGADSDAISAARAYGSALGEAFQLTDDLLDFCGDPTTLGKPIGMDLAAGCVTAPVAIAFDRDPALRDAVLELWHSGDGNGSRILDGFHTRMARVDAFAATEELATECAEAARAAAHHLTDGLWRDQLVAFASEVAQHANRARRGPA